MADIFISYSKHSRDITENLAAYLEKKGYTVWWDTSLLAGERFPEVINKELRAASAVIVIWTPYSIGSEWVYAEATIANERKILITVHSDDVALRQLPLPFNSRHSVPVEDRASILEAIANLGVKPSPKTQSTVKQEAPAATLADEEVQAWASVKNSTDIGLLEQFLKKFPNGRYAYIARPRLERLLKEKPERDKKLREEQAERERLAELAKFEEGAADEWPHVEEIGSIEAYKVFAERYGETSFFAKAWETLLSKGIILNYQPDTRDLHVYKTGDIIKDADFAPEMVVVPPGKFLMGSVDGEGSNNERPQHEVKIDYPLAVGRFAVTFNEWDYYASQVSDAHNPDDKGWGRGNRPVINVNWDDAQAYIQWLSEATGENYRLLSEAEWEYVCRAGTNTDYWWGNEITYDQANYNHKHSKTLPVDSFDPNPWGLYNVHGNVWEWVQDQWHGTYQGSPTDGSAWEKKRDSSASRVLRGGSWYSGPRSLRSANRVRYIPTYRNDNVGFRISRTL